MASSTAVVLFVVIGVAVILIIGKIGDWFMGRSELMWLIFLIIGGALTIIFFDTIRHPPTPRP